MVNKIFKFKLYISIVLCLLVSTITFSACSTEQEPEPYIYIALGDSVASGYGLVSPTDRYTYIFHEMLRKDGYMYVEEKINKAIDGYTTTLLLELLEEMTDEQLKLFKSARIITLNIGGNNILVPFGNYLSKNQDAVSEESERIEEDNESEDGGLREKAIAAWSVISDAVSSVIGSGRTLFGSFSEELEAELENGVQSFTEDFREIIIWLGENAPRATIIVNTIYNPIPDKILIIPVELSNKADELIRSMNTIIIEDSKSKGYYVADVYSSFANEPNITSLSQFNLNPFGGFMSVDIIHPNKAGHIVIAELIYEQYVLARESQ